MCLERRLSTSYTDMWWEQLALRARGNRYHMLSSGVIGRSFSVRNDRELGFSSTGVSCFPEDCPQVRENSPHSECRPEPVPLGREEKSAPVQARIPLHRFGTLEIADLALFLASPASDFICGQGRLHRRRLQRGVVMKKVVRGGLRPR